MKVKLERVFGTRGKYVTRLILGRLRVQKFHRGDEDPHPHTHPADFWTFPLVSYYEEVLTTNDKPHAVWQGCERIEPGVAYIRLNRVERFRWHFRPADYCHRIMYPTLANGGSYHGYTNQIISTLSVIEPARSNNARWPIWTINWWGPKKQEWGFMVDGKIVPWREYIQAKGLPLLP